MSSAGGATRSIFWLLLPVVVEIRATCTVCIVIIFPDSTLSVFGVFSSCVFPVSPSLHRIRMTQFVFIVFGWLSVCSHRFLEVENILKRNAKTSWCYLHNLLRDIGMAKMRFFTTIFASSYFCSVFFYCMLFSLLVPCHLSSNHIRFLCFAVIHLYFIFIYVFLNVTIKNVFHVKWNTIQKFRSPKLRPGRENETMRRAQRQEKRKRANSFKEAIWKRGNKQIACRVVREAKM